jgi:hypothetical protein
MKIRFTPTPLCDVNGVKYIIKRHKYPCKELEAPRAEETSLGVAKQEESKDFDEMAANNGGLEVVAQPRRELLGASPCPCHASGPIERSCQLHRAFNRHAKPSTVPSIGRTLGRARRTSRWPRRALGRHVEPHRLYLSPPCPRRL